MKEKVQMMAIIKKVIVSQPSGFCVASAEYDTTSGIKKAVTLVGNFYAMKGEKLNIEGEWVHNDQYGVQFKVSKYEKNEDLSEDDLMEYLQEFKSIGPARAKKIVSSFGIEAISVIRDNYHRLIEIGISDEVSYKIYSEVSKNETMNNLIRFLGKSGVSTPAIQKIFEEFGPSSIDLIKKNPYLLYNRLHILSFSDCDFLAKSLLFKADDSFRVEALISEIIERSAKNGHCYMHIDELISSVCKKIYNNTETNRSLVLANVSTMLEKKRLILEEDGAAYLPMYYYAERYSARKLRMLIDSPSSYFLKKQPEDILTEIENSGVKYAPEQKEAILKGLSEKVLILTGGPGTGKTTTVNGILKSFILNDPDSKIVLAAPTGKAAKRMEEATKMNAKTIHRLLEYKPYGSILECKRNAENPIDADIVVIDEFSMVDILLFEKFLNALAPSTKLIIVGDVDQLPSVGAGNVLEDLINSKVICTVRLKTIFRQAAESPIVSNAYKMNSSEMPVINDSDFTFEEIQNDESVALKIVDNFVSYWKKSEDKNDVQVLTPMKKSTACGSRNLNKLIQEKVNPYVKGCKQVAITIKDATFYYRTNDKVIQTRNNYEKGCFNGDTGYIVDIETTGSIEKIIVLFDNGLEIEFIGKEEILELELAYALTIHKSQGSEYKTILVPIVLGHKKMLAKNLLYTGVTRAKKDVHLYGQNEAMQIGVNNTNTVKRLSKLAEKIL